MTGWPWPFPTKMTGRPWPFPTKMTGRPWPFPTKKIITRMPFRTTQKPGGKFVYFYLTLSFNQQEYYSIQQQNRKQKSNGQGI